MENARNQRECTVTPTVHIAKVPRAGKAAIQEPFGLKALWIHYAKELELRRLAKLHLRIHRKELALQELTGERQRIMNRCIKRMRRASGKS